MQLNELNNYLAHFLQVAEYSDYCPNGLQVEGKSEVQRIVTGVTASMALLEKARALNADAIIVHHGYFWRGESQVITGIKMRRLKYLLASETNLFAFHLPLDAHKDVGNNVMLGDELGLNIEGYLDDKNMVPWARLSEHMSLQSFADYVSEKLDRKVQSIGSQDATVQSIAWCTGAAQGYIEQAIANDIDVFISGEISEQTVHLARESKTAYLAAGHHATERYGVKALGEHLANKFDLQHHFIDINNPV